MKYKSLRKNTIFIALFSLLLHLLYYGSNFIVSKVGLNFEWNIFYLGIAETLGYLSSGKYFLIKTYFIRIKTIIYIIIYFKHNILKYMLIN